MAKTEILYYWKFIVVLFKVLSAFIAPPIHAKCGESCQKKLYNFKNEGSRTHFYFGVRFAVNK